MKNKIKKYLLIGGFSFFLIKGIIWLLIIAGAFFGIQEKMYIAMNDLKFFEFENGLILSNFLTYKVLKTNNLVKGEPIIKYLKLSGH